MKSFKEFLGENWSKGSSTSYTSDAAKAKSLRIDAGNTRKRAASLGKDHPSYNGLMVKYHKTMAKQIKHAYHAAQYGHSSEAKKDHKEHLQAAKEYEGK